MSLACLLPTMSTLRSAHAFPRVLDFVKLDSSKPATATTMPPNLAQQLTRRHFFGRTRLGVGTAALAGLLPSIGSADDNVVTVPTIHHRPRAKRIVYLFMSGGPSQIETFDYKPHLRLNHGQELPDSVRMGQRLTGMSGNQASLPIAGSIFDFHQHGESGAWISDLLPHTAGIADDLCIVHSVFTEAINHDPAITFIQTGSQIAGRPSLGAWLDYGLGSTNENLPSFCVLVTKNKADQPLYARLWGSGFLPSNHQGVQFRAGADPVLYLSNPEGVSSASRRKMLDRINGKKIEPPVAPQPDPDVMKAWYLSLTSTSLGLVGMLLGTTAWLRREDHRLAAVALVTGFVAVAWVYVVIAVMIGITIAVLIKILQIIG